MRAMPKLRHVAFNLTDFGAVGDGVTLNTKVFKKAVLAISKLGKKGCGQPNVLLPAPFNLTSHMTLFLAEDAEIFGRMGGEIAEGKRIGGGGEGVGVSSGFVLRIIIF